MTPSFIINHKLQFKKSSKTNIETVLENSAEPYKGTYRMPQPSFVPPKDLIVTADNWDQSHTVLRNRNYK